MGIFSYRMLGIAVSVGLSGAVIAQAAEPSYDELKSQVDQLRTRLDQLETKQAATSKEVDDTVKRVIEDANRRSQLLAADGALTAGYDKGFYIKSDNGNFSFRPGVLFQFRNITTSRSQGADDLQNGFEFRRLRPRVDGNVLSPDLTYTIVLDTNRDGGAVTLLDALIQYRFAPDWAVKVGQFRESWYHEGDVPDYNQLTVERSLVDAILGGTQVDRVQGLSLIYGGVKDNPLRAEATFHDGANSKNTDFRDVIPGATATDPPLYSGNFGAGGRVEYKVFGDWADYKDFTAKNDVHDLLVLGGGFDWTENGDTDTIRTTVDAQYENTAGWNAYAAFNGNFTQLGSAPGDDHRFDWGALAQVGYLIQPQWELFGRYDVVSLDSDFVTGTHTFNEITAGVNYFFGPDGSYLHRAKITLDAVYLPDGSPSNQTGTGVLSNPGDDEFVFRAQFQLLL